MAPAAGARPGYGRMFWFKAEHVVRIPGALQRDEPVVLRVAVDRAPEARVGLGDVVHVPARKANGATSSMLATPLAARFVKGRVVPHDLRREPDAASRPVKAVPSSGTSAIARPHAQIEMSGSRRPAPAVRARRRSASPRRSGPGGRRSSCRSGVPTPTPRRWRAGLDAVFTSIESPSGGPNDRSPRRSRSALDRAAVEDRDDYDAARRP